MSRTIRIGDDVYKTLKSLKEPGDSFADVIRLHVCVPAKNNAELLEWHESRPEPRTDREIFDVLEKGRGRYIGHKRRRRNRQ